MRCSLFAVCFKSFTTFFFFLFHFYPCRTVNNTVFPFPLWFLGAGTLSLPCAVVVVVGCRCFNTSHNRLLYTVYNIHSHPPRGKTVNCLFAIISLIFLVLLVPFTFSSFFYSLFFSAQKQPNRLSVQHVACGILYSVGIVYTVHIRREQFRVKAKWILFSILLFVVVVLVIDVTPNLIQNNQREYATTIFVFFFRVLRIFAFMVSFASSPSAY